MDRWTGAAASLLFASSIACIGCVARGSRIRTPEGFRRIEELEVGDEVYSVDPETGELVAGEITAVQTTQRECVAVACGEGDVLTCTSDHPVYDPEREAYANAGDWVRGDRSKLLAVTDEGVESRGVTESDAFVGVRRVFDLTVDTAHHNFVANGYLVHNKSPLSPECRVDGEQREEYDECTCSDGRSGRIECNTSSGDAGASSGQCVCGSDAGSDAGDVGDVSDGSDTSDADGDTGETTDTGASIDDTDAADDGGDVDDRDTAGADAFDATDGAAGTDGGDVR